MIELIGAECSRIDRVFTETTNIRTVVHYVVAGLRLGSIGKSAYDILKRAIKGFDEIERLVQQTVGKLAVM